MENKYQEAYEFIERHSKSYYSPTKYVCTVLKELVDKSVPKKLKSCTCEHCNTYNETWEKRMNTVSKDVVYCWHCGQAHEFNKENE